MKITEEQRKKEMDIFIPVARVVVDRAISYHVAKHYFSLALMHEALKDNDGSVQDAALSLGINKNWAYRMVQKGGLDHVVKNQRAHGKDGKWQPLKSKAAKRA